MAIARLQPEASPAINYTTPETIEAPNKSIFTSLVPESRIISLLKYIEGHPWTVVYYGQILNTNNTLEHFDPSTPNLTQPYYKINDLILQVDSPLSSSYDSSTGITTVTGSAIAPYKITPNVGDVFLAQVDTGEDAIFHITSVSRKTHRKDTLYEVSYSLYSYTSENPTFVTTIDQRVNDTYFFNKDSNFFNRDILVKPSVKEATDRLKVFLSESIQYYLNTFVQTKTGSILIPGIEDSLYDPLLSEFISKIIPYDYLVETSFFRHTYISNRISQPSIYDLLLSQTKSSINNINKQYAFLPSNMIQNRTRIGTAYHTGVDYILHPVFPNIKTEIDKEEVITRTVYLTTPKTINNFSLVDIPVIETTNNNAVFIKPLLHDLFLNDYYIVTENFYLYLKDNTAFEQISYIEFLIARFINKEPIAREDLAVAIQEYQDWSLLHQLYLLPVMMLLVKYHIE